MRVAPKVVALIDDVHLMPGVCKLPGAHGAGKTGADHQNFAQSHRVRTMDTASRNALLGVIWSAFVSILSLFGRILLSNHSGP
jgi:hypothetical protein